MNELRESSSSGLTILSLDEDGLCLNGGVARSVSGVRGDTGSPSDCPPIEIRGRRWMTASSVLRERVCNARFFEAGPLQGSSLGSGGTGSSRMAGAFVLIVGESDAPTGCVVSGLAAVVDAVPSPSSQP